MNRLKTYQMDTTPCDIRTCIDLPLKDERDLKEATITLNKVLEEVCTIWLGVFPTQINTAVTNKVMTEILKKHTDLSLNEIRYSFERKPLSKVIVLTVPDLLTPIEKYKAVKYAVSTETKKLYREIQEEEIAKKKSDEFLEESLKMYRECLKTGEWIGTVFHSFALAKSYLKDKLPEEIKQSYFESAKLEEIENKKIIEKFPNKAPDFFGFNWQRIAAKKYVSECINKKIEI